MPLRPSPLVVVLAFAIPACGKHAPDKAAAGDAATLAPPSVAAPQPVPPAPSAERAAEAPAAKPAPMPPPPVPKDVKGPPPTAKKTRSGLAYAVLESGPPDTRSPGPSDIIVAHYAGWMTNGKLFDSSFSRGEPSTFAVSGVVSGWSEGLQLMKVGDRYRFWIPAKLAYGDKPRPGVPYGMIVFDVQLLEIKPMKAETR